MADSPSSGTRFREAVASESPLQVLGAINAYAAIMAEQSGAKALYLSGAGVANAAFGLPDLGLTTLENVCEETRRITAVTAAPLLGDACHLEDQVAAKRCGHRPDKELVSTDEMVDRLKNAVTGRPDPAFVIMARTDAAATEGLDAAVARANAYLEAGADMIFAEALVDLEHFRTFTASVDAPVLANMTEFGNTPLIAAKDFADAGIKLVLYPLSAFRAMNKAALTTYQTILKEGSQEKHLPHMQSRDELYEFLDYHNAETEQTTQRSATPKTD